MKKTMIIPLAALFSIMLLSCNLLPDLEPLKPSDLDTLEENSFYAQNMVTEKYYKVSAEMLYEGEKCVIWAEKGSVTQKQVEEIAHEYDNVIRPKVVGMVSKPNDDGTDILDDANQLAGRNDGKLTILLLDIKDGFKNPKTDSYVAGYFFGGNFQQQGYIKGSGHYSNGRDMIYIDTNPGLKTNPEQTYATFAHELQHLISYVTSRLYRRGSLLDIWIDEGLSSQAEYLYLQKNPEDKCEWFSADQDDTIKRGNNFFVWDNHSDKPLAIIDDYVTVYLFFRWLYLQADDDLKSSIFYDIENSAYFDHQAVTDAAGKTNSSWNNWEDLLRTWLAANYDPHAPYGYKGDRYLQDGIGSSSKKGFRGIRVEPIGSSTISLYPGEGVYSIINDSFSPATNANNIRYAGLAGNTDVINTFPPYEDNILLTFNANENNTKTTKPETGSLTGVPPRTSRTATEDAQTKKITGPYVLDARDILNRAGR